MMPLPILAPGMDVDGEDLRDPALQEQGEGGALVRPVVVANPIGLQGVEALEVEQRLGVTAGGRVAAEDSAQVLTDRRADPGIGVKGVPDQFAQG